MNKGEETRIALENTGSEATPTVNKGEETKIALENGNNLKGLLW